MSQPERPDVHEANAEVGEARKRPYQRPEFRFECVFETRALMCQKNQTNAQCQSTTVLDAS